MILEYQCIGDIHFIGISDASLYDSDEFLELDIEITELFEKIFYSEMLCFICLYSLIKITDSLITK
jgi:hypothetical protein